MSCTGCRRARTKLIEVHESSWTDYMKEKNVKCLQWKSFVCGECLVGKTIPALRSSIDTWQMGVVEAFDWKTHEHRVRFDAKDRETILVSSTPFREYVARFKLEFDDDKRMAMMKPITTGAAPSDSTVLCSPTRQKHESGDCVIFRDGEFSFASESDNQDMENEHKFSFPDALNDSLHDALKDNWMPIGSLYDDDVSSQTFEVANEMMDLPRRLPVQGQNEAATKICPRLWNEAADRLLLDSINAGPSKDALRWPEIAKAIPGRTGKQCRERYLNHLKPNIRQNMEWTPAEEALLFHLFNSIGSKWVIISRHLPGRSDNAVKNRYHFIRRKLEKLMCLVPPTTVKLEEGELATAETDDKLAQVSVAVDSILALRSSISSSSSPASEWRYEYDYEFGPFSTPSVVKDAVCRRCSFAVPSQQTGRTVCSKTGWCQSCTKAPPFASGKFLRKLHSATVVEESETTVKMSDQ